MFACKQPFLVASVNSLSFHQPSVFVCVCLLETDSRAITSIKEKKPTMNFHKKRIKKKKEEEVEKQ